MYKKKKKKTPSKPSYIAIKHRTDWIHNEDSTQV